MARHDTALRVAQSGAHIRQLTCARIAPELRHGLSQTKHGPWVTRVTVGQHTAMRVQWFSAAGSADAAGQPVATFTFGTKAKIFNLNEQCRRKAVIELQEADIGRTESCLGVGGPA